MKKLFAPLFFLHIFFTLIPAQLPAGFIRERIVTGLNPTSMTQSADGRIFITEKDGQILIVRDNELLDAPLLSIEVDNSNERGLGHMALHPDFENNGYFYTYSSVPGLGFNRIVRYQAHGDRTIPGSELNILDLDPMGAEIHNGGAMEFGFDGYLYITTGDGGQSWKSEDISSTNGKVLRLDEDGHPASDNPWYDLNTGRANYVYSYGLRNPFTMALDPLTGELFFNDVGGNKYEEINRILKGAFYGWPIVEGKQNGEALPPEYVDPIYQYNHTSGYCSIVGSAFYNPPHDQFPENYKGLYFFSDYCRGHIRMLDPETGQNLGIFFSDGDRIIDLMVSHDGSLYYLERQGIGDGSPEDNTGTDQGALWKISYTGSGEPVISVQPVSVLVSVGENAEFKLEASGTLPLEYKWYRNNVEITGNNQSTLKLENVSASDDSSKVYAVVSNEFGQVTSDTVLLKVTTNHRPTVEILQPGEGSKYTAGSTIHFSGTAIDAEDGLIGNTGLSWKIDFHHGEHVHPAMDWVTGINAGEWVVPSLGESASNVWYRIYFKATDSEGFSKIVFRDILPTLGYFHISADPQGLLINLDGAGIGTPYSVEGVQGVSRFISAPDKQMKGDTVYIFQEWHDGSTELTRELKATTHNQTLVGKFKGFPAGTGVGLTASYYDNVDLTGTPVSVLIDPELNHHFQLKSPVPELPIDFFSIEWSGYLQAYKSGNHTFTIQADDGVIFEIDESVLIDEWNEGVHYVQAEKYLEEGRLYPIRIRMYESTYTSQLKFKWSSPDFKEEVVPTSQLYPAAFISGKNALSVLHVQSVADNSLKVFTESFRNGTMDFVITSALGQVSTFTGHIPIGKNAISVDISQLASGIYFLSINDPLTGEKATTKFVKVF